MTDPKQKPTCERVERDLFELRDGDASEDLRKHLDSCSRCRELADWDRRFSESLRAEPSTPSSNLPSLVRDRLRSRSRLTTLAYATAASVLIVGILSLWRPWSVEQQMIVEVRGKPAMPKDDLAELPMLFEPPPVDSLDVLTRQQNGYVVALRRLGGE